MKGIRTSFWALLTGIMLSGGGLLQAQGVGGGLTLAGVASQIDGDTWGGYNKLGLSFGGFAWYDLSDRLALMPEITFGYRGSREVVSAYGQVSLSFIDVPVLLRWRAIGTPDGKSVLMEGGLSANILLAGKTGFKDLKLDQTDNYRKLSTEVHLGMTAQVHPMVGLYGRWSLSLSNLNALAPRPWLQVHYLSFGVKVGFKAS